MSDMGFPMLVKPARAIQENANIGVYIWLAMMFFLYSYSYMCLCLMLANKLLDEKLEWYIQRLICCFGWGLDKKEKPYSTICAWIELMELPLSIDCTRIDIASILLPLLKALQIVKPLPRTHVLKSVFCTTNGSKYCNSYSIGNWMFGNFHNQPKTFTSKHIEW